METEVAIAGADDTAMPYSRATMAQWLKMPPVSVTIAGSSSLFGQRDAAGFSSG